MGRQTKKKQPNKNRKARISKKYKRKQFFKVQVGGELGSELLQQLNHRVKENLQQAGRVVVPGKAAATKENIHRRKTKTILDASILDAYTSDEDTDELTKCFYLLKEMYESLQNSQNKILNPQEMGIIMSERKALLENTSKKSSNDIFQYLGQELLKFITSKKRKKGADTVNKPVWPPSDYKKKHMFKK